MSILNFNPVYIFYLLIGMSAAMVAEAFYLLFYNQASYRKNINRRLKVLDDKTDRESVLSQLRRERGLTSGGDYRLPLVNLNQLVLQSGLSIGFGKLMLCIVVGMALDTSCRWNLAAGTPDRGGVSRLQRSGVGISDWTCAPRGRKMWI